MSSARWRVGAALFALSCAPAVTVRPGSREEPCQFRVRTKAQAVFLSGTMTGWKPVALERRGGEFTLSMRLPPGRYEYRLEARDGADVRAVVPEGAECTPDGFGGDNLILRIR